MTTSSPPWDGCAPRSSRASDQAREGDGQMCGIAGEVAFRGARADAGAVARMSEVMGGRGPDGSGAWSEDAWVAFGHRRLAVIDLSEQAHQPMSDEALQLTVVFNGCIYNHHELRAELS